MPPTANSTGTRCILPEYAPYARSRENNIEQNLSSIRVGVAGLGQLSAQVHLPNLRSLPGVKVAALADPVDGARRSASLQFPSAVVFDSIEEMIAARTIDALLIATPTGDHFRHALLTINAGLPFYIEKPLTADLPGAVEVWRQAAQAGVPGMMGFNYRFHPAVFRIRDGLHGAARITSVFTIAPRELPLWKRRRESGGGVLLDLASHHLDLLPFLLRSPVISVGAVITSERTEQDCAGLVLEFACGARAECSFSFCRTEADAISIQGDCGFVRHDRYAPLSYPRLPVASFLSYLLERRRSPWKEVSFRRSLAAWLDSVRAGDDPPVPLSAGVDVLKIIAAAERSSAAGGSLVPVDSGVAAV